MSKLRGLKQSANGDEVAVVATSSNTIHSSMESEITTTIPTTYNSSSSARKCQDKDSQPPNQKPIYIVPSENENTASRRYYTTCIDQSLTPTIS